MWTPRKAMEASLSQRTMGVWWAETVDRAGSGHPGLPRLWSSLLFHQEPREDFGGLAPGEHPLF